MTQSPNAPQPRVSDLVQQYKSGKVGRRDFLRKLVGLGFSTAAAYTTLGEAETHGQVYTTQALGEEGNPTTKAVGEEAARPTPTTLAVGEETQQPKSTTKAVGEETQPTPTTQAVGEENQARPTTTAYYNGRAEEEVVVQPQPTTTAAGEEGATAPNYSTRAIGEENAQPTTSAQGEETSPPPQATTLRVGEENSGRPTTLRVGEEQPATRNPPTTGIPQNPIWRGWRRW